MTEVTLTHSEIMQAALVGVMRQLAAMRQGLQSRHGADDDKAWQLHIDGAIAEAAFAKYTNKWWSSSVNTFRGEADVGGVEVRFRSKEHYSLIVRDDDSDSAIFVHVTGRAPTLKLRGWIHGGHAKQQDWRKTYGGREGAYFVPNEQLSEMSLLSQASFRARQHGW